ncbi:MAG: amino acid permease [Bacteroidetes bacterium]|nr:amino acid permease [Bacteroidota bacterium]
MPLKKNLSLYGLIMVAIGSCIGSGIFLVPSQIASHLPSPDLIILVWALGGLITLTGALTFAELAGLFPKAGGVYVYLKEAYGDLAGFLYGWAYLTVVNTGAIAALCIGFTYYLGFIIPMTDTQKTITALVAIIGTGVINIFGVKIGEYFSNFFTGIKILGILAVIAAGLFLGNVSLPELAPSNFSTPDNLSTAFGLALVGVLWSYGGWQHTSYLSGEARNASRNIPMAMIFGALVVTLIYLATNFAYMFMLPIEQMVSSERVAADAISTIFPAGGTMVAALIAVSTLGTAGIYTLTAPRIYYAMAADGIFYKKLAEIHPKYGTPVNAILLQSVWAGIILIIYETFEKIVIYVVFTDWIFFTLAGISIFIYRRKLKDQTRPYKTLLYPITPIIFVVISGGFVINTLVEKPAQAWAGLSLLVLGLPFYFLYKRFSKKDQ